MPFDAFLKLDGIKGESTDSKHKDEIEVLSFSFGVTQSVPTSGSRVPKVDVQDFSVVKNFDAASPALFVTACAGKHVKDALFTVRKRGADTADYLKIKLTDLLVSGMAPSGSADGPTDRPLETVSFDFARIEIEYTSQTSTGATRSIKSSWDLLTHKGT